VGFLLKNFPQKKGRTNEEFFCGICNCFYKHWSQGQKRYPRRFEHFLKHHKNLRSVTENEYKSVSASEAALV
jgi:hypothetical protein